MPKKKKEQCLGFGKYKDVPLKDVPKDYLVWVLEKCEGLFESTAVDVIRHLYPSESSRLMKVKWLIQVHAFAYHEFKAERFLKYVEADDLKVCRVIWKGVAAVNKSRRGEASIIRYAARAD
jgi:hypothetical protein